MKRLLTTAILLAIQTDVFADKLSAPLQMYPIDESTDIQNSSVAFKWQKVTGAGINGYRVVISENKRFTGYSNTRLNCIDKTCILGNIDSPSTTTFTTPLRFSGKTYYWKVQAISGSNGKWSKINTFKTAGTSAQPQVLPTVSVNNAPTISLVSANSSSVSNQVYSVQLKANDADNNLDSVSIDWGDNSDVDSQSTVNNQALVFNHLYAAAGNYTWKATAIDLLSLQSQPLTQLVKITAPQQVKAPKVIQVNSNPSTVQQGSSITFSAVLSSNLPSGYSVKVIYGSSNTITMSGSASNYSASVTPNNSGAYKIGVYDSAGKLLQGTEMTGNFSVTQPVPVNVAPSLSFISGNTSATTNTTYSVQLQAADSDNNLSSITIDWGDGASEPKTATNNTTLTFSHIYNSAATYNCTAFS